MSIASGGCPWLQKAPGDARQDPTRSRSAGEDPDREAMRPTMTRWCLARVRATLRRLESTLKAQSGLVAADVRITTFFSPPWMEIQWVIGSKERLPGKWLACLPPCTHPLPTYPSGPCPSCIIFASRCRLLSVQSSPPSPPFPLRTAPSSLCSTRPPFPSLLLLPLSVPSPIITAPAPQPRRFSMHVSIMSMELSMS